MRDAKRGAPDPVSLRARVLGHFDRHKRDLPWRANRDPYRVLVSEVMLQQTRTLTVVPYYSRWLERFPDVASLAAADLDDVLLAWKGLGYYRRARNLHRAARVVVEEHGGRLPRAASVLRELPGVGEYTAGAVSSIAFGEVEPAVDGNVKRVLSRLYDLPRPTPARLRSLAADLVDPDRPGDFNEALMELGATVCTPRAPGCEACPVESCCLARARGTVALRPATPARRTVPEVEVDVAVVVDGRGRGLLVKRPAEGLLAGLWEFPEVEALEALGVAVCEVAVLSPVQHAFTHLRVTYRPRVYARATVERVGRRDGPEPITQEAHVALSSDHRGRVEGVRWEPLNALTRVALPVAQQRIAAAVRAWLETTRSN